MIKVNFDIDSLNSVCELQYNNLISIINNIKQSIVWIENATVGKRLELVYGNPTIRRLKLKLIPLHN